MKELVFVHDHIFHVINTQYFSGGGLPSYIWPRYLKVFESMTVVGRQGNSSNGNLVKSSYQGVNFQLLKSYNNPKDFFFNRSKVEIELKSILLGHKFAIIRLPSVIGVIAAKICRENGIPVLFEVVGSAYDSLKYSGLKGKIFGVYLESKMKREIKMSEQNIYVTERFLQKSYPSKGDNINVSNVMLGRRDNIILENRINFINRVNREHIKIGLIGSISVPYKGHKTLIKAFSTLEKDIQAKCTIYLVGGGSSENLIEYIEKLQLSDKIVFLGPLKAGDEICNFLDDIDLYVHPSLTEGLPRVILEAFSRACPVLGSNAGGIPELLDKAYIHKAGDANLLATQLSEFLFNRTEFKKMALSNFNKAAEFEEGILNTKRLEFLSKFKEKYSNRVNNETFN